MKHHMQTAYDFFLLYANPETKKDDPKLYHLCAGLVHLTAALGEMDAKLSELIVKSAAG